MNNPLRDSHIVLGVTGSIACYKAADIASKLTQEGAHVDVILTQGAGNFITPLTFRSLTHRPVVTDMFDTQSELAVEHVALAHRADLILVAPATAHCMAKLAHGMADDPLTTTVLASSAPLVVAPAMDGHMYDSPATQENIAKLRDRGAFIIGPAAGRLASGLTLIAAAWYLSRIPAGIRVPTTPLAAGLLSGSGACTAVSGAYAMLMAVVVRDVADSGALAAAAVSLEATARLRPLFGALGFALAGGALIVMAPSQWRLEGAWKRLAPASAVLGIAMQFIWIDAATVLHAVTGVAFTLWLVTVGVLLWKGQAESRESDSA